MGNIELIHAINNDLAAGLPETISLEELYSHLTGYINELIKNDFEKLITYLYRIDVNEQKLKQLLKLDAGQDAGNIIATLIIERQLQKIKTRQEFSRRDNDMEEEKW